MSTDFNHLRLTFEERDMNTPSMLQFCNSIASFYLLFSDPPFAPRELKVVEYNVDYVTLSWIAPEHDGGSPILGYVVEKRDSMMNMWSPAVKADNNTFTVKVANLFEGQSYLFRVAAENQCGRGAYTELDKPVLTKLPYGKFYVEFCLFFITTSPSSSSSSSSFYLLNNTECSTRQWRLRVDDSG